MEALVWRDGRLFSAGLYAQVIEWDLDTLTPKVGDTVGLTGEWVVRTAEWRCGWVGDTVG